MIEKAVLISFFDCLQMSYEIAGVMPKNSEVADIYKDMKPIHWSVLGRSENCPPQQWHRDMDKGCICVFPIYPEAGYTVSLIKGTHSECDDIDEEVSMKECVDKIVHLELDVGQVLIADSRIIHRGGPISNEELPMPMCSNKNDGTKIDPLKNMSIHGYLLSGKEQKEDPKAGDETIFASFKNDL